MKKLLTLIALFISFSAVGKHRILSTDIKTLQVNVNSEWLNMPVMQLNTSDLLEVGFDEMSHDFHRYIVHLEHCEADWSPSGDLFESDWLEGFNDWTIEDYNKSINTTVLFTHYSFQIPNDFCKLKMSGNYRLHVIDEGNDSEEVLVAEFMVVEQLVSIGLSVSTNTDIDLNNSHQQLSMRLNYNTLSITNPEQQLLVKVMQNAREDNMRINPKPNIVQPRSLVWEHNRELIFEGGNEYHRFEVLNPTHTTLGLELVRWNEDERRFHVWPDVCEPQINYLFYQDADGAFYVRNSDNVENNLMSDYVFVHYRLAPAKNYNDMQLFIEGKWTTEVPSTYFMQYNSSEHAYHATVLQKMGYYNYQILMSDNDGKTYRVPEEGSFYQTENRYQAIVYYKGTGERTWRLVGYNDMEFSGY